MPRLRDGGCTCQGRLILVAAALPSFLRTRPHLLASETGRTPKRPPHPLTMLSAPLCINPRCRVLTLPSREWGRLGPIMAQPVENPLGLRIRGPASDSLRYLASERS